MKTGKDKFNKKPDKKGMHPIPKKGENETTGYNVNRDIDKDDNEGSGIEEFIEDKSNSNEDED